MRSLRSAALFALFALPLAVTSTAFASTSCEAVSGNLVTNCGFETGTFSGWTLVDPGNYSSVDKHNPFTGTYAATLGPEPGSLSQTVTDVFGTLYYFSFNMQNEVAVDANGVPYPGADSFQVSVIDKSNTTTNLFGPNSIPQTNAYASYGFYFVGSGSDTIMFTLNNVPSYYDLDNVSVNAPTPEPSSLALMGTGAIFFAEITRRRFKKA
ncbi:MAG: hypothetical protein NVSMB62_12790 [Acidobacteriaceae bacterium]